MRTSSLSRREFLASSAALLSGPAFPQRPQQRAVVIMFDGFGLEYMEKSEMPTLAAWSRQGLFRRVRATMPSVTNTNNASICCGVWPNQHGITGNSYFDERTGKEAYMEDSSLLLAPTLFERAALGQKQPLTMRRAQIQGRLPVWSRRALDQLLRSRLHGGTPKARQTPAQLGPPRQFVPPARR